MARGDVRIAVTLACEDCKRRNYQTNKSRRNSPDRIELRKFCRWCGKPHGAQGDALAPMAKTRAQRKAERRAREEQERKRSAGERERRVARSARHPGAGLRRHRRDRGGRGRASRPAPPKPRWRRPTRPSPPAPERRAEAKALKESEKRQRGEQKRRESEQLAKKQKQAAAERQRGGVIGFLASCWAELKKVQWPDRDTLVQATAVTIIFVAVAATYLGALDAVFNFLIKQIL